MKNLRPAAFALCLLSLQAHAGELDQCQEKYGGLLNPKCKSQIDAAVKKDREICLSKEKVRLGMSISEVQSSRWMSHPLGVRVNTTETLGHVRQQWVFEGILDEDTCRHTSSDGYQYLYFDNGILTAIQR